jgi:hypothetical protein
MGKIKTIAEKIDEMIASYEELNREAHTMIDLYIDELRLQFPRNPFGSLKMAAITGPAGASLNVPQALRILKEKTAPRRDLSRPLN